MKKAVVLLLAGVLAFSSVPVRAAEAGASTGNAMNINLNLGENLAGLQGLLQSDKLEALHLENFDIRTLDIDGVVQMLRNNEYVKNLDLSTLNLEAVVGLVEDSELLKSFGLESVNKEELLKALQDKRIMENIVKWTTSASKGESIADAVRSMAHNTEVQELFSKVTGGKDLLTVLNGMNSQNVMPLLQKGMAAIFSEKAADTAQTAEDEQDADIAALLGGILQEGRKALMGADN